MTADQAPHRDRATDYALATTRTKADDQPPRPSSHPLTADGRGQGRQRSDRLDPHPQPPELQAIGPVDPRSKVCANTRPQREVVPTTVRAYHPDQNPTAVTGTQKPHALTSQPARPSGVLAHGLRYPIMFKNVEPRAQHCGTTSVLGYAGRLGGGVTPRGDLRSALARRLAATLGGVASDHSDHPITAGFAARRFVILVR